MSLHFARIYGELAADFMRAGDSENAAIVAYRAFHYAMIVWTDNLIR